MIIILNLKSTKFFSKNELKQINLFKNDFDKSNLLKLDLLENNKKHKIVIYKIKDDLKEYDYQKAGGLVYAEISKFKSANILFDTDLSIKNNKYKFFSNFLLGLLSRSYNFKNYKLKKIIKKIFCNFYQYYHLIKQIFINHLIMQKIFILE
ncbi:MAG: hypothetical protein FF85_02100 [alpha proteobacterium QL1]|nr:MAG: hypothetical protein FF85_02100 [alpha proteobacterium QL1]